MRGPYGIHFVHPGFAARVFDDLERAISHCRIVQRELNGNAEITPTITLTIYDRRTDKAVGVVVVVPLHWEKPQVDILKRKFE